MYIPESLYTGRTDSCAPSLFIPASLINFPYTGSGSYANPTELTVHIFFSIDLFLSNKHCVCKVIIGKKIA